MTLGTLGLQYGHRAVRQCLDAFREKGANAPPHTAQELNLHWGAWLATCYADRVEELIGPGVDRAEVAYHPHLRDHNRKEKGLRRVEVLLWRTDGSRVRLYPRAEPIIEEAAVAARDPSVLGKARFLRSVRENANFDCMGWKQALVWATHAVAAMRPTMNSRDCACVAKVPAAMFPIWRFIAGFHRDHDFWTLQPDMQTDNFYVAAVGRDFYPTGPNGANPEWPCGDAGHSTAGGGDDEGDDADDFKSSDGDVSIGSWSLVTLCRPTQAQQPHNVRAPVDQRLSPCLCIYIYVCVCVLVCKRPLRTTATVCNLSNTGLQPP